MRVKPALDPDGEPLRVRDPHNHHRILLPDGADVPETAAWHRRLLHGDVVLVEPEPEKAIEGEPT